jgi:hypothetical protein
MNASVFLPSLQASRIAAGEDEIIDCCGGSGKGSEPYDTVSSCYDTFLTSSTILARLYNALVWGLTSRWS